MLQEDEVKVRAGANLPYFKQREQRERDTSKFFSTYKAEQVNEVYTIFEMLKRVYNAKDFYEPNFRQNKVTVKAYGVVGSNADASKELEMYANEHGFEKVRRLNGKDMLSICFEAKRVL